MLTIMSYAQTGWINHTEAYTLLVQIRLHSVESCALPGDTHAEVLVDLYGMALMGDLFVFLGPAQHCVFIQKSVKSDYERPRSIALMGLRCQTSMGAINFRRG